MLLLRDPGGRPVEGDGGISFCPTPYYKCTTKPRICCFYGDAGLVTPFWTLPL